MAGEWQEVTVGHIAAAVRNALVGGPFGSNLVTRDYAPSGVPVIRGQNMGGRWVAGEFVFVSDAKADALEANIARPGDIVSVLIVNFPTKDHWRSPSRLSDIERGLDHFVAHAAEWGVRSVAMPPLGCGNGGLEWSEVGPLIYRKLHTLPIDVEVYAPYATSKSELTREFLGAPSQMSLQGKGRTHEKLKPDWVALMEVLRDLQAQPYANPVGRTIFQKICYVVTEMGVPTGFVFGKGSYGPFSDDVKLALHDFANR
ncbi:Appr-1-p processing domain protein, partial [mine drainage metagenome]